MTFEDTMESSLLILSDAEVQRLLPMAEAIRLMRDAFGALSSGQAEVPVRPSVSNASTGCTALCMPASADKLGFSVKAVTVQPDNLSRGLPAIHGLVLVFDGLTGRPNAVMAAEALTAIRTGAASGLATDLLSRDDASVLAVFGTGPQARTQIQAVCEVRPIERIMVFGRDPEKTLAFAEWVASSTSIECTAESETSVMLEADIVCTATSSMRPVFDAADVAPGTHINGVGSFRPDMIEVPPATVRDSVLIVDHRMACLAEAGDVLAPYQTVDDAAAAIHAELGEVVLGRAVGRPDDDAVTFFKSVGNAVQDLFVAEHALKMANQAGIGQRVSV